MKRRKLLKFAGAIVVAYDGRPATFVYASFAPERRMAPTITSAQSEPVKRSV